MDRQNLIQLSNILANYRKTFYITIKDQQKVLEQITNIPVYYAHNSSSKVILDTLNKLNQKLILGISKLNKINCCLLKVNNIQELIFCINKFDILNLDFDLINCINKQEKLLQICNKKGFITFATLKGYEQICVLTNCLYLSAINQLEICEGYIINYLKNSNTSAEVDDIDELGNELN